jgi:hypothetical protein
MPASPYDSFEEGSWNDLQSSLMYSLSYRRNGEKGYFMKNYIVTYQSRYYQFDTGKRRVSALSKRWIRDNWHGIMLTDEYRIVKIVEEKA